MKPPAAVVLARRHDGLVLGVSRKEGGFALPGGGIEEGESSWAAAFRELREETGYEAVGLVPLFAAFHRRRAIFVFEATALVGHLRSSSEGVAAWLPAAMLAQGPYGRFFERVIDHSPLSLPARRRPAPTPRTLPLTRAS